MIDINRLVRKNIRQLKPYSTARHEHAEYVGTFLDANENPYGANNRYPDPFQTKLKNTWANRRRLKTKNLFVGNGSDEVIDLVFRIFCKPGIDKALQFTPTYGMYEVSASIHDVDVIGVPLTDTFQISFEKLSPYLRDPTLKLIFICSPNNPTGNCIDKKSIIRILQEFEGIVLIDEAYVDFSKGASMLDLVEDYNNLIVCQTLSKAWGLANMRIGIAYANDEIIQLLNAVKPPYNISGVNQQTAIDVIQNDTEFQKNLKKILNQKNHLKTCLESLDIVRKVYPSDANFFLVEFENANTVYHALLSKGIIVRNRNMQIPNCLRITVGTEDENTRLINALTSIQ